MSSRQDTTWTQHMLYSSPHQEFYPQHQHTYTSPYSQNATSTPHYPPSLFRSPQPPDPMPMTSANEVQNAQFRPLNQGHGGPFYTPAHSRSDEPHYPPPSLPMQTYHDFSAVQNNNNSFYHTQPQYPRTNPQGVPSINSMPNRLPSPPPTPFSRGATMVAGGQYPQVSPYGGSGTPHVFDAGTPTRPRTTSWHQRRQSQQDAQNRNLSLYEHRGTLGVSVTGRRSERSISPRSSAARRGYERFSHGSSLSATSFDVGTSHARTSSMARIRHRQQRPRGYFGYVALGPNEISSMQIERMKAKLTRHLPADLPEGKDPHCDICQKDYATEHVQASDEQEVAVQLPCGHFFGEFCLSYWMETCMKHKNKITCPMCRVMLVDPLLYQD